MKAMMEFLLVIILILTAGYACAAAAEKAPDGEGFCLITNVKDVPRMPVDELKSRLKDPSLILIDVRAPEDWNASSTKIPGAFRETSKNVEEWAPTYDKDKTIVLYCA